MLLLVCRPRLLIFASNLVPAPCLFDPPLLNDMQRAREKTGGAGAGADNEEDAIVAALAKTGGGGGGSGDGDDAEDRGGVAPPSARRAKVSINIFEDVDDRWVDERNTSSVGPIDGLLRGGWALFGLSC